MGTAGTTSTTNAPRSSPPVIANARPQGSCSLSLFHSIGVDAAGLPGPNPSEPRSRNIATAPIICNRAEGRTPARQCSQCCSKHSRLLLAQRALETALGFFPKRHRLGELRPAGLGQRNQAIALVVIIRDHFDQTLSLERFDVVSQC